jgi:hypothetical protein
MPSGYGSNKREDRRFEAWDEALVAVGRRVGEGVQRAGVLDHAADEVERRFAQPA